MLEGKVTLVLTGDQVHASQQQTRGVSSNLPVAVRQGECHPVGVVLLLWKFCWSSHDETCWSHILRLLDSPGAQAVLADQSL